MIKENKREPLKVSLLTPLTSLRTPKLKIRKLLLKKPSEKSKKERKLKLQKDKVTKRW